MSVKRPSQVPVLIVYVITMLLSLAVLGSTALVLLDVFVTKPRLEREAAQNNSNQSQLDEQDTQTDYASARETILFVGADGDTINGIALIRVMPDKLAVRIVPVSPQTLATVSGNTGTIASLYSSGGLSYLVSAVENAFGVECDKYIKISNEGFASLVEYLGGTSSYSFPQELYYKNDLTGEITSFAQGQATRTLWGDDIRRIITYPLYNNGNEQRVQVLGELSVALINTACQMNSQSVVDNIQTIFNSMFNNSDTDMTLKSFQSVREAYEYLILTSKSPAAYRLPAGTWDQAGFFTLDETFISDVQTWFELSE